MKQQSRGEMMVRSALRIFGYQVAFGFVGFLFIPSMLNASAVIRVPVVGLLIVAVGVLMFNEGSYHGERDWAVGETLDKLARKGSYTPSATEEAKRYRRMKGVWAAVLAALPLFALALVVAVTAKPYEYIPQDLPGWMSQYLSRAEVGDALAYVAGTSASATVVDYLRIIVRFVLFPYIGLFGEMTDAQSLLFDRLSPLVMLLMPALAAIGYQFGPARWKKQAAQIEQAKRTPRKRLKKDAKRRKGPAEKKQLI